MKSLSTAVLLAAVVFVVVVVVHSADTTAKEDEETLLSAIQEDLVELGQDAREALEYHRERFWEDVDQVESNFVEATEYAAGQLEQAKRRLEADASSLSETIHSTVRYGQRRFRRTFIKEVLEQRVGWMRVRHSVRDHMGALWGLFATLHSSEHAVVMQTALLCWELLEALPHQPWLADSVSVSSI